MSRKPDVQVIDEILREHGPLHILDIVKYGKQRGVSFAGSKKETLMARDKMYASKRFTNLGRNVWAVYGYTVDGYTVDDIRLLPLRALRNEILGYIEQLEDRIREIKSLLGDDDS